jgi:neurotransmitter:Na+ symporter, NSS family
MKKVEQFSSRWGIIFASLGMAIGAGNLWRFPRLAGQYGGSFILLWMLFLMVWSIPLLLAEFSIGKKFKRGVIGSFGLLAGKRYAWMGFFITICTLGIAFYYSVVTAWSIEYLWFSSVNLFKYVVSDYSLQDVLTSNPTFLQEQWTNLSNESGITISVYLGVILIGMFVVNRGIQSGLERANKIIIPGLFVLLIIVVIAALRMPNGSKGLEYMFLIDPKHFSDPKVWIEALSQSAWSTGAGWGLIMTISSYSREKEEVTLNTFIGAFGNNTASILSGMAILPAVFAMAANSDEAITQLQSGSQALTFTIIPKLFSQLPGGYFMAFFFFLTLTLAAFSSFLPMLQLFRSNMVQAGISGRMLAIILFMSFALFGFPSAYSLDFFTNQDWVWGIGLIVSGLFVSFATLKHGAIKFKEELIDQDSDFRIYNWFFKYALIFNMIVGVVLIYWWMSQGYSANPWFNKLGVWNVIDVYSNATIVTQWGIVMFIGVLINKTLFKVFCKI